MVEIQYLDLSLEDFIKFSKKNSSKLIVIDFNAKWCKPCKQVKPFVENMVSGYPDVIFYQVDIENEDRADIVEAFNITALPTFIYYKNGEIQHTLLGTSENDIENKINQYI